MKQLVSSTFLIIAVYLLTPYGANACIFYGPDGCEYDRAKSHRLGGCTSECDDCIAGVIYCDDWE